MMVAKLPIAKPIKALNSLPLMPPKNKRPMAITAITMKAPMSGCNSNKTPTAITAAPIGAKPFNKWCK